MIEEAFQRMTDMSLTTCKHCSGTLHKIISQSSFHLKGSGWYVTDYANNKGAPPKSTSPPKNEPEKTKENSIKNSDKAD
jgi:putative FmdB family regulatory protein